MNDVSNHDNVAIGHMNRFNGHCPLIGRFSAKLDSLTHVIWKPSEGKAVEGKGYNITGAYTDVLPKILPIVEKLDGEGEGFIGQRAVAKAFLAEK